MVAFIVYNRSKEIYRVKDEYIRPTHSRPPSENEVLALVDILILFSVQKPRKLNDEALF